MFRWTAIHFGDTGGCFQISSKTEKLTFHLTNFGTLWSNALNDATLVT